MSKKEKDDKRQLRAAIREDVLVRMAELEEPVVVSDFPVELAEVLGLVEDYGHCRTQLWRAISSMRWKYESLLVKVNTLSSDGGYRDREFTISLPSAK